MIVDRLFDRALPWIASHRLSIPNSISKLRSNQRSLDLYSNPSLLCHAVMVHSFTFSFILLGCGLWICTCITSAVSISSIYFGSILQISFTSNNNSILHRSSRSVYCSFSSCGIGFPSSPYLFFAAFHPGNLAVELRVCRSPNPHLFALSICPPITRRTFSLSLSSNSV